MSLEKISADVRGHIKSIITKWQIHSDDHFVENLLDGSLGNLSGRDIKYLQGILDNPEFWLKSEIEPQLIERYIGFLDGLSSLVRKQYIFQNYAYKIKGELTPEQEKLLIQDDFDSERRKFEQLQGKLSLAQRTEPRRERAGIPEKVRIAVWRRDNGCCVKCGSREKLEYDHIIPISRGGSNTVRNIELLCEKCNRSKSDNIQ